MKKSILTFSFNNDEKFIINLKSFEDVHCCYRTDIFLVQQNKKNLLSNNVLDDNMKILIMLLKKALVNELQLHKSIIKDIGYLYNQYTAHICGKKITDSLVHIDTKKGQFWAGTEYYLWSGDFVTWIYNDKDGNIIFEVTPFYPYMYCERNRKDPHYVSYKKWIKTYKPYLVRIISVETAKQWIEQAESIIKKIEDNVKKFEEEAQGK